MTQFGRDNQASTPPTSLLDEVLRQTQRGRESIIDLAQETLDDGTKKISLALGQRRLNPEPPPIPIKAPSPKRQHSFYDIAGFIAYLTKFGSENTVVLANPLEERISAILNENSSIGFEVVVFTPQVHPIFAPWNDLLVNGESLKIKEFVEFLANNRRSVASPNGRELLLTLSQIRMSKNVELWQGTGKHSLNGLKVETSIAGTNKTEPVELPDSIVIQSPIYLGTDVVNIEIDLNLNGTIEHGVVVSLAAGDLIEKRAELFEKMLATAVEKLQKVTVAMGEPNTAPWEVLTRQGQD